LFVRNGRFVGFGYTDGLPAVVTPAAGRGVVVKLVQRLAKLLLALATPAALGAPRKWS
jgi:hypothetical protein